MVLSTKDIEKGPLVTMDHVLEVLRLVHQQHELGKDFKVVKVRNPVTKASKVTSLSEEKLKISAQKFTKIKKNFDDLCKKHKITFSGQIPALTEHSLDQDNGGYEGSFGPLMNAAMRAVNLGFLGTKKLSRKQLGARGGDIVFPSDKTIAALKIIEEYGLELSDEILKNHIPSDGFFKLKLGKQFKGAGISKIEREHLEYINNDVKIRGALYNAYEKVSAKNIKIEFSENKASLQKVPDFTVVLTKEGKKALVELDADQKVQLLAVMGQELIKKNLGGYILELNAA